MKIKFQGGPWDGVEFEAGFAPDVIRFHHLAESASLADQLGIPENDPDFSDFEHPLRALVDAEPTELQHRTHLGYNKEQSKGDGPVLYHFSQHAPSEGE